MQENTDIIKIKRTFVPKGMFSENSYVFILIYQTSSF